MKTQTFVSVTIADTPGALGEMGRALANHDVNIEGFSMERGSVRFLTKNPEAAKSALVSQGFSASLMEVYEVALPNQPGMLAKVGEALGEAGVGIIGTFGVTQGDQGFVYLRVDDKDKAEPILDELVDAKT